jgi:hypothetical protein
MVLREVLIYFTPSPIRGRRESRMRAAPAVSCANLCKKHAHEHTGPAEAIRLSLRSGFNAYFRALPGDQACLTPSPREYGFVRPVGLAKPPRDLTPTMRRQDHTISSSAKAPFVCAPIDRSRETRPAITPARGHCRVHRSPPQRS